MSSNNSIPNSAGRNQNLLSIKNLQVSFFTPAGEVKAVNDISYDLKHGEVLGIVGESGSGKSVSSYTIMGLLADPGRIVGGHVNFNGHKIEQMSEKEFRKMRGREVSIIFQDPMTSLNPVYSIGNQMMEMLKLHTNMDKQARYDRSVELLGLVGLNEPKKRMKQYPHEFSGGMRQRVMIAMSLACEPKLLIADEPTTALDVTIQAQIMDLIMDLREKINMSVILITHDLGVVSDACDKIVVMYAGKVCEIGSADDIFYDPKHEYTLGLLKSIPKINSDTHERLIPIEGTPVDLLNAPKGCPFAPRCDKCMKICLNKMPPMTKISGTHSAACWMIQKAEFYEKSTADARRRN